MAFGTTALGNLFGRGIHSTPIKREKQECTVNTPPPPNYFSRLVPGNVRSTYNIEPGDGVSTICDL